MTNSIARTARERIKLVPADQTIEEVQHQIQLLIEALLAGREQNSRITVRKKK